MDFEVVVPAQQEVDYVKGKSLKMKNWGHKSNARADGHSAIIGTYTKSPPTGRIETLPQAVPEARQEDDDDRGKQE